MKKISDIRKKRENRFWENRMKLAQVKKVQDINDELEKHKHLISDVKVREQVEEREKEKVILKE